MEFSVENLPAGLTVNPKNGHITGRITSAEKKTYHVTLQAKNSKGSDAKAFRIVVGEQIALTPPLGWNSWNCWHQKVSQAKVLESAKAMSDAGLQRVGWMYINMDDGWQAKRGGKHNAVMPNTKFPDMKGMVDEIHAMGFKAGIYHTPWVGSYAGYCGGSSNQKDGHDWPTDSVDGVGDQERYNYFHIGEHKFDKEDTLQWADWGIDYLKDDWVLARDITPAAVARRKEALQDCGRDIVYSLSNTGPLKFADTFVNDSNAWRISADIRGDWDTRGKGAGSILAIMNLMKAWAPHCGPGHYPDADMMVVDGVRGGKPAKLTGDEQYTHVSLWSLWSSPMLLGSAVDKMGEFGLSILSNPEVLEIHQDALCNMATVKNSDPFGQVWVKPLEHGDTAVGLINLADEPRVITADWSEIGVPGKQLVRDVWRQRNIQVFEGAFSAMVPSHGTVLLRLSDPVAGSVAKGEGMKQLPSAPKMRPNGGAFTGETMVTFKTVPGATIHYTLNGSRPNQQSPIYTAPFKIASFTGVKAVAIQNGVESGVSSSQFLVAPKRIPEPDVDATTLEKTRSYAEWRDVNINKTGRYDAPFKHQGTVYQQGLGFYGAGSISYPLDPSYERFVAMACLDDFSVEGATGRFVIEIDGKLASASPMMKKGDPAWLFDVKIPEGAKTITLICYRDRVGPQFVFNYLNCGFVSSGPTQVQTITSSADKPRLPEVALSELNELNVTNGWRQWQKNQNFNGQPLQIGGTVYKQGLGLHANAEISYALKPEWQRFVATVGVHASAGDKGSVQFSVEVDGTVLGCSPVLTGKSPAHHFNIALPKGAQQIRLISSDGGDDIIYDHANWVNCGFTRINGNESAENKLSDVVYKTVNGTSVMMDIYYPAKKRERAPVFYYTHGGGWWAGDKKLTGHEKAIFRQLLDAGVVCVSANYRYAARGSAEHPVDMRDCVVDARDGLRYLKKNEQKLGIDTSRVVTFGTSAGAHISLMLNYSAPDSFVGDSELVAYGVRPVAGVSWHGPADFTDSDLFVPNGFTGHSPNRFTDRIRTGSPRISYKQADPELKAMMREVSPVRYLTKDSPPMLQFHGDRDGTIPLKHGQLLQKRAAEVGAPFKLIIVKGANHDYSEKHTPTADQIIQTTVEFVLKSLPESTKAPSAPAFKPGQLWLDNNGVHINVHGGGVMFHEGTYYWYGEHKVKGTAGNRAQVGVRVYSSKDLCNWKDEGVALQVSDDPKSDIAKGCILERPKVIYNAKTGKFVMWFHLELKGYGYRSARSGIAISDKPAGPFKYVRSIRPNAGHWPQNVTEAQKDKASIERTKKEKDSFSGGPTPKHEQYNILGSHFEDGQMARDMNLFVDDDGKGYHIYSSEHNSTLHISQLTDDYLDHAGTYTRNFPFRWMEAPAVFKRGGKYYLIASGCTGWNPNTARSAVADSILGPWKELGNPCIGTNPENRMGPNRTFGGQSTYVLKVHGKKDAYIAMFDIWRPNDAIDGRYIWLPIQFNEKGMTIEWSSEWELDVFNKQQKTY